MFYEHNGIIFRKIHLETMPIAKIWQTNRNNVMIEFFNNMVLTHIMLAELNSFIEDWRKINV